MQIHVINTGFFKLDGGAMFGVVPKTLWSKQIPADENNLCSWAMRCLLIEIDNRIILIDNGLGDKQDARFFSHYYLHGNDSLEKSLHQKGLDYRDVSDMFLTHLHFDHCGGGVKYLGQEKEKLEIVFPNAKYWSNEHHWQWATTPNAREKASFLKENILPMQESGHLHHVPVKDPKSVLPFDVIFVDGHTDKQMLPVINYKGHTIVFCADLIPSTAHIPIPYVMGYDTRPLLTMEEKSSFLNQAADNAWILFFEHDAMHECCTVKHTDKGVRLDRTFPLSDLG